MAAGDTGILAASRGQLKQRDKDGGERQKEEQRKDKAHHSKASTAYELLRFQNALRARIHLYIILQMQVKT